MFKIVITRADKHNCKRNASSLNEHQRPPVPVHFDTTEKAVTGCDDHVAPVSEGGAKHLTCPLHEASYCAGGGEHIPMMQMQSNTFWCFHPTLHIVRTIMS